MTLTKVSDQWSEHLKRARGKTQRELTLDVADAVIRSPMKLPPIPTLAEEFSRVVAGRVSDPKTYTTDEGKAASRRRQWDLWYAPVKEEIEAYGVRLLADLAFYAPEDVERFDAIAGRVGTMLRSLREIALPWWPVHRVDQYDHSELSLLDHCERELGRLETARVRQDSARRASATIVHPKLASTPKPRRDVDDWSREESLL